MENVHQEAGGNIGNAAADAENGNQGAELEVGKSETGLNYRQQDDDALAVPVGKTVADGEVRQDKGAAPPIAGLAAAKVISAG